MEVMDVEVLDSGGATVNRYARCAMVGAPTATLLQHVTVPDCLRGIPGSPVSIVMESYGSSLVES